MNNTKNNHIKHWETRGRKGTLLLNGYRHGQVLLKRKYEHRRIMETFLGRELKTSEIVHHLNHNRSDNRLDNLKLMDKSKHARMHAKERGLGQDRKGIEPINKTSIEIRKKVFEMRRDKFSLLEIKEETGLSFPTIIKYARQIFNRKGNRL